MTDFAPTWLSIRRTWRRLRPAAFIGGLGLSAIAGIVLVLSAYFAGTAPRLPSDAGALEILKTADSWPQPVRSRVLDATAPSSVEASPVTMSLLPHSDNPADAPPIDISDLPPPAPRLR